MDEIINKKIQLTLYALMFKIVLAFWSKQVKNIIWLDEIKLKKKKKIRKGYKLTEQQNALIVTC